MLLGLQCGTSSSLKHLTNTFLAFGRTFQVRKCVYLLRHGPPVLRLHRLLLHLLQFVYRLRIVTQVLLVANQYYWHVRAEVFHFGRPLLRDVLQTVRGVDGEAHQDHVRVRIGERPQPVVVLLAGGIPQRQLDLFTVHFYVSHIILEDGRHVHLGKLILAEHDQEASFAASAVAYDDQLLPYSSHGTYQNTSKVNAY